MSLIAGIFDKENLLPETPTAKALEKDIKGKVKRVEKLLKETLPTQGTSLSEHQVATLSMVGKGIENQKATLVAHVQKLATTLNAKDKEVVATITSTLLPLLTEQERKIKEQLFSQTESTQAMRDISDAQECLKQLFSGKGSDETKRTLQTTLERLANSSMKDDPQVKTIRQKMRDYETIEVYLQFASESIRALRGEKTGIIDPEKTLAQAFKKFDELGLPANDERILSLRKALATVYRDSSTIQKSEQKFSECLQKLDEHIPHDPEVIEMHTALMKARLTRLFPAKESESTAHKKALMKFAEMHWNTNEKLLEVGQLYERKDITSQTKMQLKSALQLLLQFRNALMVPFNSLPIKHDLDEIVEQVKDKPREEIPGFIKGLGLNIREMNQLHGLLSIQLIDPKTADNRQKFADAARALKIAYEQEYIKQSPLQAKICSNALDPNRQYGPLAEAVSKLIAVVPENAKRGLVNFQANVMQKLVEGILESTPKDASQRKTVEAAYSYISPLIDELNRTL